MRAMCAYCRSEGCAKCKGQGYFEVKIPEGDLYTLKCSICGFENGGRIVSEEFPLKAPDIDCVRCGASKEDCAYVKVA